MSTDQVPAVRLQRACGSPAARIPANARLGPTRGTMRDQAEVTRFFDGLELVDPGIVQAQWWRPAGPIADAEVAVWCGVGRKA
jgi:hypothetical protein